MNNLTLPANMTGRAGIRMQEWSRRSNVVTLTGVWCANADDSLPIMDRLETVPIKRIVVLDPIRLGVSKPLRYEVE